MTTDAFAELDRASLPLLGAEAFVQRLTDAVAGLIANDPSELYRLLYRFDLPEKRVMGLMLNTPPEQVARALTLLLIDRAREKALSRQRFSGDFEGSEEERW